jgi:WD40 repeat protein
MRPRRSPPAEPNQSTQHSTSRRHHPTGDLDLLDLHRTGDHTARLWHTADGRTLTILAGHTDWVANCAFSPDGTLLTTPAATERITARVSVKSWSVETMPQH